MLELSPYELEALRLSLWVGTWSVCASLPFGILAAWVLARLDFPGKSLLDSVIHLPLVLPPVVVGYVLMVLLGSHGFLGPILNALNLRFMMDWKGAVLAAAVIAFPLMVRAMRLSLENIDRGLEDAARTLGATQIRVFFTITLPLMAPGILTGSILCFARSLSEFGATITFAGNIEGETQTLPLALFTTIQSAGAEMEATRLCVISVLVAFLTLLTSEWLAQRVQKRVGVNRV